ncbi:hypothetical protein NEMBOFW57_007873 [Staphylotrichum longicolle]|uniref:Uncharacterized protein n=1 Tax=Staphylotrichum longicolle TaxID=669026 RepID=A0AAD4EVP2_9PEZI|nr:hypothetical protein NEMBOFW57_007873 [Staphylotrichum longicolle]
MPRVPASDKTANTLRSRLRASLRVASHAGRNALDTVNRMRNPPPVDPPPIEGGWVVLDEEDGPTSDSDDTAKADEGFHNGGLFDPEPLNVGYVVPCASSEEDSQEDRESDDGATGGYDDGLCGSWDASGSVQNDFDAAHAEPTPRGSNSTALPAPRQSEPCSPRDQAETTEGVGRDGNISAAEDPQPTSAPALLLSAIRSPPFMAMLASRRRPGPAPGRPLTFLRLPYPRPAASPVASPAISAPAAAAARAGTLPAAQRIVSESDGTAGTRRLSASPRCHPRGTAAGERRQSLGHRRHTRGGP